MTWLWHIKKGVMSEENQILKHRPHKLYGEKHAGGLYMFQKLSHQ